MCVCLRVCISRLQFAKISPEVLFRILDTRSSDVMPVGTGCGLGVKKKARKPRTIFTTQQIERLTQRYKISPYLNLQERAKIAADLNLTQTQVSSRSSITFKMPGAE